MPPKRIAFVDHAEELGGAEKSLMELMPRLDRDRFEPILLCAEGADWLARDELNGIEKVAVFQPSPLFKQKRDELRKSFARSSATLLRGLGPILSVRRALRKLSIDLVHTNSLKGHLLGGVAARLAGKPVIWHVRDILDPGPARTWLLRAARFVRPRVIAISEAVAAQFEGMDLDVRLIHNGIPLDRFTPGEPSEQLRTELGLSPDDELLCIVGRLTPWKGHRTLLEALKLVAQDRPRAKLLVVGEVSFWEGSYEEELKALAEQLGISDRVIWLGFREDIPEILRLCDVFVLPSVDEPFGRVIIEAMAVGKPVVATRSGGVPEIVLDGETGLLVPHSEPEPLAEAIVTMLSDHNRARAMGEMGMCRAREKFDVNRVAAMVQELYDDILAGR